MEDASLGDFVDTAGDEDGEGASDADTANPVGGADEPPEPAMATYAWSPGGDVCGSCGTVVERRWRDDEGLVCGDCKEW